MIKPICSTHLLQSNDLCDWQSDEKKDKREKKKSETTPSLTECRAHVLPDPPQPAGEAARRRETGWAMQGGAGAVSETSQAVPPFPVTQETNALSKETGQWQTAAIEPSQKVTWQPKNDWEKGGRQKKRSVLFWRHGKKIEKFCF